MLRRSILVCARSGKRREMRNPNSPLGRAFRKHLKETANQQRFTEMAGLGAGLGAAETEEQIENLVRPTRSRKHVSTENLIDIGEAFAPEVKSMSDTDWEAVPLKKKRAFVAFIEKQLKEAPTEVSEHQRRRYFEMTLKDPSKMDFSNVKDKYQRLKMGLPIALEDPQQSLGVTKAMYEAADADLFDPKQAYKLENAMTHFKQLFVDYVQKKKTGTSTEMERRRLANMSADLNYQTQKHLANMFKFAERQVQETVIDEKRRQLMHIEAIKDALKAQKRGGEEEDSAAAETVAGEEGGAEADAPRKKKLSIKPKISRAQRIKATLRDVYGIDTGVATAVLREMKAQERFLQKCEVMARLTLKKGFKHTAGDESLDTYTASLKQLYSMSPHQLAGIDAAQYMAAKNSLPPLDWAKRWYENALLVPLQSTPEYQALETLRREAEAAKRAEAEGKVKALTTATIAESDAAASPSSSSSIVPAEDDADAYVPDVIDLVERMFLPPEDERLEQIHEKRLRHVAYLHMESQIKRMRANAKLFEGVEDMPEAEEAKVIYQQIQDRKKASRAEHGGEEEQQQQEGGAFNPYQDPELASLFDKLMGIVDAVIRERTVLSEADRHAERLRQVVATIKGGAADRAAAEAYETVLAKKEAVVGRILHLMEKDAREDMLWVENMMEAERPPLLPIPEPMSYVSAADVSMWKEAREAQSADKGNPFKNRTKAPATFSAKLLGQEWNVPDKPLLFWGTGTKAISQALEHAANDAERRRTGKDLAPPYPCPENPWGWKLRKDILEQ